MFAAISMDCDDEDAETLTMLHAFINRRDNVQKMKKLLLLPGLGELVLAKYVHYNVVYTYF